MIDEPQLYFDRSGQPIDNHTWARLKRDESYLVVARTVIAECGDTTAGLVVSTVWLGLNFAMPPQDDHPPMIFETMVFDHGAWSEQSYGDGRVAMRYATEDAARTGHRKVVQLVSADMTTATVTDEVS